MNERPLRTAEVSELTGIPSSTLRYWRHNNEGPPSYKFGGAVVYDRAELDQWWDEQRRATSSTGKGSATA